jgi:hypothetical protein
MVSGVFNSKRALAGSRSPRPKRAAPSHQIDGLTGNHRRQTTNPLGIASFSSLTPSGSLFCLKMSVFGASGLLSSLMLDDYKASL